MTMIWLLLDALGTVLAWLLDGVLALVDLISPGPRLAQREAQALPR